MCVQVSQRVYSNGKEERKEREEACTSAAYVAVTVQLLLCGEL